jgi:TolA-binding protein
MLGVALVTSAARAEQAPGLDELGERLWAPRGTESAELTSIQEELTRILDGKLDRDNRAVARLLAGEVAFRMGDARSAAKHLDKAEGDAKDGPYRDDIQVARIRCLELEGRYEEAEKAWVKWEAEHPTSSRLTEVRLARTWNALARGKVADASVHLGWLGEHHEWYLGQPEVVLASAVVAFLEGRVDDTIAALGEPTRPAEHFLLARSFERVGQHLDAAAAYQRVADRFRSSVLHDPALLAKANVFLVAGAYRTAADEFARVATEVSTPEIAREAELRGALSTYLDGDPSGAVERLEALIAAVPGSDQAARGQFLLAEVLASDGRHEEAIPAFTTLLANHFEHDLAPRAQYRIGRCLDALGRQHEATSSYMAVVAGYSQSPESTAAAYLAGVGFLEQGRAQEAIPYLQLMLDRSNPDRAGDDAEAAAELAAVRPDAALLEAGRYHLFLAYHRSGQTGALSAAYASIAESGEGSDSPWAEAERLLVADALATQGRLDQAITLLDPLLTVRNAEVAVPAARLLAWVHSQNGNGDLALEVEQRMVERHGNSASPEDLAAANLNRAHAHFNAKRYKEAAPLYDRFARSFPEDPRRAQALFQAGVAYLRMDQAGDAVDRWEATLTAGAGPELARDALERAGDVYVQAQRYDDAHRSFGRIVELSSDPGVVASAMLRMAECTYNQSQDETALAEFEEVARAFSGTEAATRAQEGMERCLYRLGQSAGGVDHLAALVEQHPRSAFAADAQLEIGHRLLNGGDPARAAEAFRRVVSQFSDHPDADQAQLLMAEAYDQAGNAAAAAAAYEQFLVFFPESELAATVGFRRGSARFASGDHMRAAVDFTSVLSSDGDAETKEAARFNLGLCHRMLGDLDTALATFDEVNVRALGKSITASDLAFEKGTTLVELGRLDDAIAAFTHGIDAGPPAALRAKIHFQIGSCHERSGEPKLAIRQYEYAMSSLAKGAELRNNALVRLALIHEENSDYGKALAAYQELASHSSDPELVAAAEERVTQLETVVQ